MASITRTPTEDSLSCLACGRPGPGLDGQHVVKRSQAPGRINDPTNRVHLCRRCHDLCDNGEWNNGVTERGDGSWLYWVRNELGWFVANVVCVVSDHHKTLVRDEENYAALKPDAIEDVLRLDKATWTVNELAHHADTRQEDRLVRRIDDATTFYWMKKKLSHLGQSWVDSARGMMERPLKESSVRLYAELWEMVETGSAICPATEAALSIPWGSLLALAQTRDEKRDEAYRQWLELVFHAGEPINPSATRRWLRTTGYQNAPPKRYTLEELHKLWSVFNATDAPKWGADAKSARMFLDWLQGVELSGIEAVRK